MKRLCGVFTTAISPLSCSSKHFTNKTSSFTFMSALAHTFANNPLDRCNNSRTTEGYIEGLISAPTTKFIPYYRLNPLIENSDKKKLIGWRGYDKIKSQIESKQSIVYLGYGSPSHAGAEGAFFAVDVSDLKEEGLKEIKGETADFADLRLTASYPSLPSDHAGVLAQGRAILEWHRKTQFCGKCGGATTPLVAGTKRVCSKCGDSHYPRTDPVVLVLVTRGDTLLLSKSPRYSGKVYTCVAGFIEPGETLEDAARREVKEETGIELGKVTYHSSQPWPFLGGQLMIGMIGEAISDKITIDPKELEDAQWFAKKDVALMVERSVGMTVQDVFNSTEYICPPPMALAHQVIRHWISNSNM